MGTIIAIGGGDLRKKSTLSIDREIIRRSMKKHPKLLFIPTASSDSEGYCRWAQKYFGGYLRCRVDVLLLIRERPSRKEIRRKILTADIIYVGGGNTLKMMRLWRRLGVDRLLKRAYRKGIVLCGLSAGSICWFESGHSDSLSFYHRKRWKYILVRGLGLIKGIHCPHYDSQTLGKKRKIDFQRMIARRGGFGIALDNHCALEVVDGKYYRILTSKNHAHAYRVYKRRGRVVSERIEKTSTYIPLNLLHRLQYLQ